MYVGFERESEYIMYASSRIVSKTAGDMPGEVSDAIVARVLTE
jgi:hypothetical protein